MPTTARIAVFSTDPESGSEDNVDSIIQTQTSRHEHWSVYGGMDPARFYWPLDGEMNLFLQIRQVQPAINESTFKITFPGATAIMGWECVIPLLGKVPLLLRKPATTDIIEVSADPFSLEVEAVYF